MSGVDDLRAEVAALHTDRRDKVERITCEVYGHDYRFVLDSDQYLHRVECGRCPARWKVEPL